MTRADEALEYLRMRDLIEDLKMMGTDLWLPLYSVVESEDEHVAMYSVVIPDRNRETSLSSPDWDQHIQDGVPTFYREADDGSILYQRYGHSWVDAEPLVHVRTFYGLRGDAFEVCEEFRLLFNLAQDPSTGRLIHIDIQGRETLVVQGHNDGIWARRDYVQRYCGAKSMFVGTLFDMKRYSALSADELALDGPAERLRERGDDYHFDLVVAELSKMPGAHRTYSRLLGKKLLAGADPGTTDGWVSPEDRQYADFIVGIDEQAVHIRSTCDPEVLDNVFGSRPGAVSYFTPVYFRCDVLDRYYSRPDKYSVGEAGLSCGGLWSIRFDASRDDHVVVMLGELGKYLHYEEQLHWHAHNVAPGGGFSEAFFDRNLRNRPGKWTQPDHAFRDRFSEFKIDWHERFGWPLFLDLNERDQYRLETLHVPLHPTQGEFDQQVLALAIALVDSLNAKRLQTETGVDDGVAKTMKSIGLLQTWLEKLGAQDWQQHVGYLRSLQGLRSSGSAHRKGEKHQRQLKKLGIDGMPLDKAFAWLLRRAGALLEFLDEEGLQNPKNG